MTALGEFRMDGLWAALGRLDRLLERATAAADASYGAANAEPYRGLYVSAEDVGRALRREAGAPLLAAGASDDDAMPESSRFPWLGRAFGLSSFELDTLLLALAPEIDSRYERLFAYLHDDVTRRRPTVELSLNLLCATREAKIAARNRFASGAPLIRERLLQICADAPGATLLTQSLKVDDSIVRFLLGETSLDARVASFARFELPEDTVALVPADRRQQLRRAVERASESGSALRLYFQGPPGLAKRALAHDMAASRNMPLLAANLRRAAALEAPEFDVALGVLFREAQLAQAVLCLDDLDSLRSEDRRAHWSALTARFEDAGGIVVLCGEAPLAPRVQGLIPIAFKELDFHQRRLVWELELSARSVDADDRELDELARRFRLSADQIQTVVEVAAEEHALDPNGAVLANAKRAAQALLQRDLGALARRVAPVSSWKDLVLPPDQLAQLREVCGHARRRHVVFGDWGFEQKLSLGKGLSALFSGPPGTGKTMAAEVIAAELGLELYKIDLSQVVSKYIGETEKNMDRLFAEARASNAILFFDECDALFGKRTTVQDAHDRYANIEIAYLLQKMDEHDGLSILATNLRQNLDAAFIRRLTFIVEFPFPSEASRLRIWHGIWPEKVPRSDDLDLGFMAGQFSLPGGAVKNIAVAAAFLAASEPDARVTTEHLLWATRRELEKAGRSVQRSEFGRYAERMQDLAQAQTRSAR